MSSPLLDRLADLVRVVAGILLVIVAIAMIATITGRYAGFPTAWADETARIAYVWSACLGAASGLHRGLHFNVRLFNLNERSGPGRALEFAIAMIIITLTVVVLGATTESLPVAMKARLPALGVTSAWFHAAISAFAALSAIFMTSRLARIWRAS